MVGENLTVKGRGVGLEQNLLSHVFVVVVF